MADIISMLAGAAGAGGAEETDPDFKQTVLLLHGDGTNGAQNNTFVDSSTNNYTITRTGNTTQGTFSPFSAPNGQWSNFFDGSGDNLTFAGNAAFAFGTGDFTIEAWVYAGALTAANTIILATGPVGSEANALGVSTNASKQLRVQNNSTVFIVDNVAFPEQQWVHICVVRAGTDLSLYKNGARVGTATNSTSFTGTGGARIAGNAGISDFPGYISNVRYVKGTAVYDPTQTTLTVPTASLTAISNTSLLTCQSNRFVDNSTNAFAITRNGDVRVTPFSPFAPSAVYSASTNGGSGYFDGTGDYIQSGTNITLGVGDFTVEAWVYGTTASQKPELWTNNGQIAEFLISTNFNAADAGVIFGATSPPGSGYSMSLAGSTALSVRAWNHIAWVRSSGVVTVYLNGVSGGTYSNSSNSLNLGRIGAFDSSTYDLNGYISGLRVVVGSAVYTSGFTPPTAPPTAITNTSLLCNFTNAGIFDNTGKNNLETVADAQIDTTTKKYGTGSMEFDGTGDWLKIPDSIDLRLGTGNFTIEFWVYLASGDTGSNRGLVAKGGASTGWLVSLNTTEKVVFTYTTSTITSSGAISTNAWNHIAVVRAGTGSNQTKIYINGTNDGTGTVSTDFTQTEIMYVGANRAAGDPMKGFIDDVRITKGIARYTANFTAPTKAFPDL